MRCQRCAQEIEAGEEREYHGQILCEDCYIDALSPLKTCDPWAVHSAKKLEQVSGTGSLTELQTRILNYLREQGKATPEDLCRALGITPKELEREFAPLRHMEKVRGEKAGDKVFLRLW
jgi:late competence protein required for DNA uptake (superfamily II DNA/RNA helicase)